LKAGAKFSTEPLRRKKIFRNFQVVCIVAFCVAAIKRNGIIFSYEMPTLRFDASVD